MSNDLRLQIMNLATKMEKEDEAAFDLWSWLPSCGEAEKYHGDYYCELKPPNHEIMEEAATLFALEKGYTVSKHLFKCPCGEDHEEGTQNED